MTLYALVLLYLILFDFLQLTGIIISLLYLIYFFSYVFSKTNINITIHPKHRFLKLLDRFKSTLLLFKFKSLNLIRVLGLRLNLRWKPLFKKSSYFGLYRSNRNQWLNK